MASNAINVIAGGNTAVFSPHPAAAKVAAYAIQVFNREIEREVGVANVITTVREPSIRAAEEIFRHPGVALLCVTGGPAVVRAAMKHGKRVIAAGPGNPPVVWMRPRTWMRLPAPSSRAARSTTTCSASVRRKSL